MKHYLELLLVVAVVALLAAWTRPQPQSPPQVMAAAPLVKVRCPPQGRDVSIFPAVDRGDVLQVRSLLTEDATRVQERNQFGSTALHHAVALGRIDIIELLVQAGADVNAYDNYSMRPLHWAAKKGNPAVVRYLLCHGARAQMEKENCSPASTARQYHEGEWQKVAALLDAAADTSIEFQSQHH